MIPISTTLISITREDVDPTADPTNPVAPGCIDVADGIRAVISTPSASNKLAGGDRIVYDARLTSDTCDLQQNDTVTESDGTQWRCLWARPQVGLGLDHMIAQLRMVTGAT